MLYELEQGPVEKKIIQQCIREGLPFPNKIKNAPVLIFGLGLYLQAFNDLSASRIQGMAPGPIPWNIIEEYCDRCNLDEEQRYDMHAYIKAMDEVYLTYLEKKLDKK